MNGALDPATVRRFAGAAAVAYTADGTMIPAMAAVTEAGVSIDADWRDDDVRRVVVTAADRSVLTWEFDPDAAVQPEITYPEGSRP